MAKKATYIDYSSAPKSLSDEPFYNLILDDYQKEFRDAIWNPEKLIVFCNAVSGTGKTTIATATANLLCRYGLYDGIVYIVSNYGEAKQGYLPGDITQKSEVYFEPFYQALQTIGVNTNTVFVDNINNLKNGTAYIECLTHTFLRGTNFDKKVIILDEAQNYSVADLKKTLTRCKDSCKVIVIGHNLQCDLSDSKSSGFVKYMDWFSKDSRCAVCELKENYRGWISSHADRL
ncbi:MAG: PhoH family protein [Endomicrobiaceae bacterium]|jgi:phosphate starvation-inducible protein PhoH|nr:PhoH family protein [Endomicrobiaceae bacterium]